MDEVLFFARPRYSTAGRSMTFPRSLRSRLPGSVLHGWVSTSPKDVVSWKCVLMSASSSADSVEKRVFPMKYHRYELWSFDPHGLPIITDFALLLLSWCQSGSAMIPPLLGDCRVEQRKNIALFSTKVKSDRILRTMHLTYEITCAQVRDFL